MSLWTTIKGFVVDDQEKVRRATKAATITSLGRAAAYIRGIVRRSISKKAVPSLPGKPPHSPTGRLKASILFAVEKEEGFAVIGPLGSVFGPLGRTHEFGGVEGPKARRQRASRIDLRIGGRGPMRAGGTKGRVVVARITTAAQLQRAEQLAVELRLPPSVTGAATTALRHYPPRPFMGPALARSRERLPAFWRNSVKGV